MINLRQINKGYKKRAGHYKMSGSTFISGGSFGIV